jgi:hypothetical protein
MSKKAEKTDAKGSDKKAKKGKKGKGAADGSGGPSIAAHPRASYQVRRAKGWGGIAGFGIAAYLSYKAGVPTADLGLRAIVAGLVGYMLAWACAVTVWRHLVLAELRAHAERATTPHRDVIPARAAAAKQSTPAAEAAAPAAVSPGT